MALVPLSDSQALQVPPRLPSSAEAAHSLSALGRAPPPIPALMRLPGQLSAVTNTHFGGGGPRSSVPSTPASQLDAQAASAWPAASSGGAPHRLDTHAR